MEKENIKDFDLKKANDLLESYKQKKALYKYHLLRQLIVAYKEHEKHGRSILDSKLVVDGYYSSIIVKSVLSDLGYSLEYFKKINDDNSETTFKDSNSCSSIIVISNIH
ncbi:MAG: hypothetical protein V8R82_03810 [Clostridia bacterium]